MSTINLKLISPSINKNGDYEYDFFPDRIFSGQTFCVLWANECWENEKYLKFFAENDEKNIKVICFCSYNEIPVASYICHKFIATKSDFGFLNGFKSVSGFPWRDLYNKYNLKTEEVFNMSNRSMKVSYNHYMNLWDAELLSNKIINSPVYIPKTSYESFLVNKNKFKENIVSLIYKKHVYKNVASKIESEFCKNKSFSVSNFNYLHFIEEICGANNFCSYQILLSLYKKHSFVAFGGAASFLTLCFPICSLFCSDYQFNVREFIIRLKSLVNKNFYSIETNGFIHWDRNQIINSPWQYQCLKESILNHNNISIHEIKISD